MLSLSATVNVGPLNKPSFLAGEEEKGRGRRGRRVLSGPPRPPGELQRINAHLLRVRGYSEASRRPRPLDEKLKAEEYRNLAALYFPVLMHELKDKQAVTMWAYMAYITRLYYLPDREFYSVRATMKVLHSNMVVL